MKNVLTICAIVLLCLNSTFAQDCVIDAGMDSRTCNFQDTLIGVPIGGTWSLICTDTTLPISINSSTDSSIIVTYSECGTYYFEYSINTDSCNVSDTVFVDFEDPSYKLSELHAEIGLEYENISCPSGGAISCENTFEILGAPPSPIWSFAPYGNCTSTIFSTTLGDSVDACLVDGIQISTSSHNAVLETNNPDQYGQDDLVTLENDSNIVSESFFSIADSTMLNGYSILTDSCPLPTFCHVITPECLDTILTDTVQLEMPIHVGGNWTVLDNGNFVLLDSNNVFTIDSVDYWLNVSPSITSYNATFTVLKINSNNDTIPISDPVSFSFLWEEKWTTNTIQQIYQKIIVKDSCCSGGSDVIPFPPEHTMPSIPTYDCSPITITFFPGLTATAPTVICQDSTYIFEVELSGGIEPYTTNDPFGSIMGNIFTSSPISNNSNNFSVELMDSGGCEVMVEGDNCICIGAGTFELSTEQDCGSDGFGKLIISHVSGGSAPFLYSIDSINFQSDTIFTGLENGDYTLVIQDSFQCETTLDFAIGNLVWNTQESSSELDICNDENILLEFSFDENILNDYQVMWDDGDTSLFRTINRSGFYNATILDLTTCSQFTESFDVKDISVYLDRDVILPNAFTPNEDGINDNFAPYFKRTDLEFSSYNLKVFSRWGDPVFKSNDPDEEWLPERKHASDVYVWFLEMEIMMCDGEKIMFTKSGDLTLIR